MCVGSGGGRSLVVARQQLVYTKIPSGFNDDDSAIIDPASVNLIDSSSPILPIMPFKPAIKSEERGMYYVCVCVCVF